MALPGMLSPMDLDQAFEALEDRARAEPALNRYRVAAMGAEALAVIPSGWRASDVVVRIAADGGWWPGTWLLPTGSTVEPFFDSGEVPAAERGVQWLALGSVWERDWFFTPLLRHPTPDAPLLGFSAQALWQSLEFPTEAALIESFIVTYDELGLDDRGMVDEMFVDWVTNPPGPDAPPNADRVHRRLHELATDWATTHPVWSPRQMPMRVEGCWPDSLSTYLAGADESRIRPFDP